MAAQARVPLYDSIRLNIGINCRWQQGCIRDQERAMSRALRYVKNEQPPEWRVHLCNRNASRGRNRGRDGFYAYELCMKGKSAWTERGGRGSLSRTAID